MTEANSPVISDYNFYAQDLARKVMGKTPHDSHSIVYLARDSVPSDIVHFHEDAHRSLNSATTVGKYLVALAIVASHQPSARSRLRGAVRDISALCLYTHEGYAMAMQELRARDVLTDAETSAIRDRVDSLYRLARDQYRTIFERIAPRVIEKSATVFADACARYEEIICRVLSVAAMSVPLAEITSGEPSLPSYRVFTHIRGDSPDTRLERLAGAWTAEFLEKCRGEWADALNRTRISGTSRPADDCLNRLADELCRIGGCGFEPPDRINLGVLCEKMGLPGIMEFDGRDTPLSNRAVLDSVSLAINRSPVQFTGSMTWKSACAILRFVTDRTGITPDVVCEIFEWPNESMADTTVLMLHLYCDQETYLAFLNRRARADEDEQRPGDRIADVLAGVSDGAAFLMMQLQVRVSNGILRGQPGSLVEGIPHRSFAWVAFEHLFQSSATGPESYERSRFEACGRLIFPYTDGLNGTETYTALYAVPPKVAFSAAPQSIVTDYLKVEDDPLGLAILAGILSIPGLPAFRTVEDSFDTDLGLLRLRARSAENECLLPVVFPHRYGVEIARVGGLPVAASSYLDTCVCHTLVTGLHTEYLTYRCERGSDE